MHQLGSVVDAGSERLADRLMPEADSEQGDAAARRRVHDGAAAAKAAADPMTKARSVLAERFARGEIDEDEYHVRMSALRNSD